MQRAFVLDKNKNPQAIAARIGRKKLGTKAFQKLATKGKKNAS